MSPKNVANIMVKNVVDVSLGGVLYWAFGYGLSFGTPSNWLVESRLQSYLQRSVGHTLFKSAPPRQPCHGTGASTLWVERSAIPDETKQSLVQVLRLRELLPVEHGREDVRNDLRLLRLSGSLLQKFISLNDPKTSHMPCSSPSPRRPPPSSPAPSLSGCDSSPTWSVTGQVELAGLMTFDH